MAHGKLLLALGLALLSVAAADNGEPARCRNRKWLA